MINVLLVDEDSISYNLYKYYLDKNDKINCLTLSDNSEKVMDFCKNNVVDVLIMDIDVSLIDEDIFLFVKKIKGMLINIKIILMTKYPEVSYIESAKKSGADSFWYKTGEEEEFVKIFEYTISGKNIFPENTKVVKIGNVFSDKFSDKELEVLRELITGKTDAGISEQLHMSLRSVKGYVQSMKKKTGFKNRTELAVQARVIGLVIK